jgi:hypothetical protein
MILELTPCTGSSYPVSGRLVAVHDAADTSMAAITHAIGAPAA